MSNHEYHLIAICWGTLIVMLTAFWYGMLRRLAQVLNERLDSTESRQSIPGVAGVCQFLFRSEYKESGDERLVTVCDRLRQRLFGYLGCIAGFIVFLVIFHPRA